MRFPSIRFLLLAAASCVSHAATADEFYRAIRGDNIAELTRLAAAGSVNVKDRRGSTPLMHASQVGSVEAMKILIKAGADVNEANGMGATALIWGGTDPARVRLLLEAGAKPDQRTQQGRTALMAAAGTPRATDGVRLLIDAGADVNAKDGQDQTPLLSAVSSTCGADNVRLLLAKGADVKAADKFGFTPLLSAAGGCPEDIVRLMISKGADVNAANTDAGMVKFGKIALIGLTPLMLAAPHQEARIVRMLLDAGAEVNAQDSRGMTPLMFAVSSERQDAEVVKLLLARGADPKIKSKAGETALDWARKFNTPAILKLLGGTAEKPGAAPASAAKRGESLAKSVALIQKSSAEFFRQSGCVGCHHQNLGGMAVSAARRAQLPVDERLAEAELAQNRAQWTSFQPVLQQMIDPPGGADMTMYALLHFHAAHTPPDAVTDGLFHYTAAKQVTSGAWEFKGIARSPIEEGQIHRTAFTIPILKAYAPPGRKAESEERIRLARQFLASAKPRTTDDQAMRLLGLLWAGDGIGSLKKFAAPLLRLQRADGGWGGNPHLASDAYSTAQVLYALKRAGAVQPGDAVSSKAAAYLMSTQKPDGSWMVRSRAPKFQPYFESGFPYGHDQWISASATAWAVMALAGGFRAAGAAGGDD
jgi:ankyrin repeat protein